MYHVRYIDIPGEYLMLQKNKQRGEDIDFFVKENYQDNVKLLNNNAD